MPQSNYEIITNGTVKIFAKGANVVTATPIATVTPSNTDDLRYMFESLPEGQYTYSASAPDKGTVVGTFKLPWDGRAEDEFRKFIPDIFLTPAVAELTINLVDKDDDPDGIRSYINAGVRVLATGIDGAFTANGNWVVPNAPTTPNGLIEIIPDNPASLQHLKVTRPISDTYNSHSIKVMPPFRLLINVQDAVNNAFITSISRVYIKYKGGVWVELLNPSGGSFYSAFNADGEYEIKVDSFGYTSKTSIYTLVYPNTTSNAITLNIKLNRISNPDLQTINFINNSPNELQVIISNTTNNTQLVYDYETGVEGSILNGYITDDVVISVRYQGQPSFSQRAVVYLSTQPISTTHNNGIFASKDVTNDSDYVTIRSGKLFDSKVMSNTIYAGIRLEPKTWNNSFTPPPNPPLVIL